MRVVCSIYFFNHHNKFRRYDWSGIFKFECCIIKMFVSVNVAIPLINAKFVTLTCIFRSNGSIKAGLNPPLLLFSSVCNILLPFPSNSLPPAARLVSHPHDRIHTRAIPRCSGESVLLIIFKKVKNNHFCKLCIKKLLLYHFFVLVCLGV